jgi:hypothetical protein
MRAVREYLAGDLEEPVAAAIASDSRRWPAPKSGNALTVFRWHVETRDTRALDNRLADRIF